MTRRELLALLSAIAATPSAAAVERNFRDRVIAETTALFRYLAPEFVKPPITKNGLRMISNEWTHTYPFWSSEIALLKTLPIENKINTGFYFDSPLTNILNFKNIENILFYDRNKKEKIINNFKTNKEIPHVIIEYVNLYAPIINKSLTRSAVVVFSGSLPEKTNAWRPGDKLPMAGLLTALYIFEKRNGAWRKVGYDVLGTT